MAKIYNSDLSKELLIGGRLQQNVDKIPDELADKVVPVMEVNPKMMRRINLLRANTAINALSSTIFTTPLDRDFYITNATLSLIKDATSTSTSSAINISYGGAGYQILLIVGLTLTANAQSITQKFNCPIKVDRGTNITVTNTTNVGNVSASGLIQGYIDDISNS